MLHLFVYGTLLQADNFYGNYLKKNSEAVCKGKFKGRLYNAGSYPGAIPDSSAGSFVYGSVLLLNNVAQTLKVMDEYEGVDINEIQPSEYTRDLLDIETAMGVIRCWVYIYNLPVRSLQFIESGDYLDFISTK